MMQVKFADQLTGESLPAPNEDVYASTAQYVVSQNSALAFIAPRGIGSTRWTADPIAQTHIRRSFMLLGQTLDGMRVWDVRRALQAVRDIPEMSGQKLHLVGGHEMAGIALYAAIFEPDIESAAFNDFAASHRNGPDFLNILKYVDVPQTVAMVADTTPITIFNSPAQTEQTWAYPLAVAKNLGWNNQITIQPAATNPATPASSR
jgi:hypothetical protein